MKIMCCLQDARPCPKGQGHTVITVLTLLCIKRFKTNKAQLLNTKFARVFFFGGSQVLQVEIMQRKIDTALVWHLICT